MIFCLVTLHECLDTLQGKLYMYTIFQPTFSPIKRDQDILFKLLTLRTDSVTKRITVVGAVYFYNLGWIFATKNFVTESVLKVRSFMRDILPSLDRENVGWKLMYNFLGNDEKNMEKSLLTFALNINV